MRFSTVLVSAAFTAFAAAQDTASLSSVVASITSAPTPSTTNTLTPAQSSQAVCLTQCPASDPDCRAKCIVVDNSVFEPQGKVIACMAACPPGDGTAPDNLAFKECLQSCQATATLVSSTTSRASGASGAQETSGSGTQTRSGTAATPSATGNSAAGIKSSVLSAMVGVVGLGFVVGL